MKKAILLTPVLAVLLIVLFSSVYIVNETQQVVITQFGRPVGEAVTTPGLNFKVPFIQKVNYFDKRYLEWDGDANQIPTRDKKFILDRKSTRLNSSHVRISYAVFCLKKKK